MCKKEKNTETRPSPQLQNNLRLKVNENNCVKYVNGSEKYIYSDQYSAKSAEKSSEELPTLLSA